MPDLQQLRLPSEAEMREAIAQRNSQYDQTFLYGVVTTGVFCLPSCAARPARPENIRFFFDSHDAEQAGLRSCKRCRPLEAQRSITHSIHAADEEISYATSNTALGWILLAATNQGVCFAQFGASAKALKKLLSEEFPKATLKSSPQKSSAQINAWLRSLEAHLLSKAQRPDLPLDLRGTAFQIQVWKFLLQIPSGQTASYGEVAAGIQRKSAVRAAASACGANRIAVLIPCHRVLRGDGSLGGYRWGTQRKQQLLDQETRTKPL